MRNVFIGKLGKVSATSKTAYRHYKKNAEHRNKENTYEYPQYRKVLTAFYGKVARDLVENDSGVFLKGLGYFTILRHPKKQIVKVNYQNGREFFNTNSSNYLWLPSFIGIAKRRDLLKFWTMDRTFSRTTVKTPLHEKLMNGKTYKTLVSTLSSLYLFNNN